MTVETPYWKTVKLSRKKAEEELVIPFSGPLNAVEAVNPAAYQLDTVTYNKKKGPTYKIVPVYPPTYIAATDAVALVLREHCGLSRTTVQREWKARGIKPHLVKTFKVSNDPDFEHKLIDVVGLYMNPPDGAIVLSFDEKSQIQALDRTQQSLPMKQGRPGTVTHDYKRHGTTTLFAALNVLTGELIGECFSRHRHQEFLAFLRLINRETPRDREIHIILDNYGTHKHPDVVAWLDKHKRFHFHFTPTSSSWLNMVERWFADITIKRIRRGSFASVPELVETIENYIARHNDDPTPFIWTKTAKQITTKVRRGRVALESASQSRAI